MDNLKYIINRVGIPHTADNTPEEIHAFRGTLVEAVRDIDVQNVYIQLLSTKTYEGTCSYNLKLSKWLADWLIGLCNAIYSQIRCE